MSVWHESTDFDIDRSAKQVDFLVMSNYQGNVYLSVSFATVKYIYERIATPTPEPVK